jgi:hypothetical protein
MSDTVGTALDPACFAALQRVVQALEAPRTGRPDPSRKRSNVPPPHAA